MLKQSTKKVNKLYFEKHEPVIIYHGKDGQDGISGSNGEDGEDGVNGTDGKDGETPIIGVKQDIDEIYYWTLNGDWLKDKNGHKIKAQGTDGSNGNNGTDGINGTNGKDGITPQLKIEDGYWYISYNNGVDWTILGKATGENGTNGDNFFQNVTDDDDYVYLIMKDGNTITIPKYTSFSITFHQLQDYKVAPGHKIEINFSIKGGDNDVKVSIIGGYQHSIEYNTGENRQIIGGKIILTASLDVKTEQIMLFAKSTNHSLWESFTITTDYEFSQIGDLYFQTGIPVGFICKAKSEGQSGMLISCIQSGTVYMLDGYENPEKWLEKCRELDSNWYIPSSKELVECAQAIVDYGLDEFNQTMSEYGYETLSGSLWSSTVENSSNAYAIFINDSQVETKSISRGNSLKARAIRKF